MHLKDRVGTNEEFIKELKIRVNSIEEKRARLKDLSLLANGMKLDSKNNILEERLAHVSSNLKEVLCNDLKSFSDWLIHVNEQLEDLDRRASKWKLR